MQPRYSRVPVHLRVRSQLTNAAARWSFTGIALLAILFVSSRPILAAQPTNDVCEGAEVIPSDALFPYWTAVTDISEATTINDPPPPSSKETARPRE